jgi:pyruvate, orthophosphate dikinase
MFIPGGNASLGVLQGALSTAISGMAPAMTQSALNDLQQIQGLHNLSDLQGLTTPDNLARMAGNPLLFQTVAQVLKIPQEVSRQLLQTTTAPATPPASSSQTAEYRPAMCAMEWEGADLPDVEVSAVGHTAGMTTGEIAHRIFTDIHELQGKLRMGPLEKRIREYAERLDLSQGVQIYRRAPTAINEHLDKMLGEAWLISKLMDDGDPQGYYRDTLHRNHSRQLIVDYLDRARTEGPPEAIRMLERALFHYDRVCAGTVDLERLGRSMSRAVKDDLQWPETLTLENLGAFAISLRKTFDVRGEEMKGEDRYFLMRLAIALDGAAFGLGAFHEGETGTPEQALKMATLIEVLYGTGFGDERWLAVAERLRQVSANWAALGPHRGAEEIGRYGALAAHILGDVKTSYHSLFDALVHAHGKAWGLSENDIRTFTRSLYRTGALFPLGQHLAALHAGNGNRNRAEQILDTLLQGRKSAHRPYAPVFLGDGKEEDLLVMGNKGKGLNELTRLGEPVPAGFALPPLLMADNSVLDSDRLAMIDAALTELERRTGKSFTDGSLKVSVRSGAAVSMPGTLLTVIKVGSREDVLDAIRTVYQSWDNPSAQLYRRLNGVPEDLGTSVIVQEWIETNDDPKSGFGLATSEGESGEPLVRYGAQVQGIDLVSGKHSGRDDMDPKVARELKERMRRYEDHFHYPVEIEYAVEKGRLWMLQVRRAQLKYEDEIRWAVQMIREGRMTREAAIAFLGGRERLIGALNATRLNLQGGETLLASEAKGGGQPISGTIALDETGITALQIAGLQAIFVTDNADAGKSAAYAFEAGAVIFHEGNGVSHLEGDLRASNRPHLGGIPVQIDREARTATIGGVTLKEGDIVTLDPPNGSIYGGAVPIQTGDSPVASLIRWLVN